MKYIQKINSLSDLPIVRPLVVCDYDQRNVICKDKLKYLKFTSTGNSTISLYNNGDNQPNIEYSLDNGETWTPWDYESIELENGESVLFRGNNPQGFSKSSGESGVYSNFVMTGSLAASGDVMTLINKEKKLVNLSGMNFCFYQLFNECTSLITPPTLSAKVLSPYCYYSMFAGCSNLTIAPTLPAQTMAFGCYYNMFRECTKLTETPILPSTKLADYCYACMFYDCSSLTTAMQTLPATTLADSCYRWMFYGCSSLVTAPNILATTLADYCCLSMFCRCSSLVTAPNLPVTILTESCYKFMFYKCSSLVTTPILPATTLAESCYEYMFGDCSHLTSVPELPAMTLAPYCYQYMFAGCTSLVYAQEILPAIHLPEGTYDHPAQYGDDADRHNNGCYRGMFCDCTSLTRAPILPAKTLTRSCYSAMFYHCDSLQDVYILAEDPRILDGETTFIQNYCSTIWLWRLESQGSIPHNVHVPVVASSYWNTIMGETYYSHNNYLTKVLIENDELQEIIEQYHIVYDD